MIRFISVRTKPEIDQNNLDILVDNHIFQKYTNAGQNFIIESEFGNTIIYEIILHIFPNPEKEIIYKCYNLNELNQEYKIISGRLMKIRNQINYSIYSALIKSEVPYTRMTITVQTNQINSFQIYYFGVRGKQIEEETNQLENQEQKTQRVILKPGRKTEIFNNKIVDNDKMTFSEFFSRVKSGQPISKRDIEPYKLNCQDNNEKMNVEQIKIVEKQQEESKVKDDDKKYITLQDDDENSVQFIDEKVKQQQIQQQINKNHFYQQKCCFTDSKSQINNKLQTKQLSISKFPSQLKTSINDEIKAEYNVYHNMIKYSAQEIDQEFLNYHKTIEESRNINAKNRLIHRLNTQQY